MIPLSRFPYQAKLGLSLLCLGCWFTVSTVVWLLCTQLREKRSSMQKTSRFNSYTNMSIIRSLFPRGAACLGLAMSSLMPFIWQITHIAIDLACCESTIYIVSPKTEDGMQWGILQTRECNPMQMQDAWCGFGAAAGILGSAAVVLAGLRGSSGKPPREPLNPGKIVSIEESMSTLPSSQQQRHVMSIEQKLATPRGQPAPSGSSLFAGNTPRKCASISTRSGFSSSSLSTLSEHPEKKCEQNLYYFSVPLKTIDDAEFQPSPNLTEATDITVERLDKDNSGEIAPCIFDNDSSSSFIKSGEIAPSIVDNHSSNVTIDTRDTSVAAIETPGMMLEKSAPGPEPSSPAPLAPGEKVVRRPPPICDSMPCCDLSCCFYCSDPRRCRCFRCLLLHRPATRCDAALARIRPIHALECSPDPSRSCRDLSMLLHASQRQALSSARVLAIGSSGNTYKTPRLLPSPEWISCSVSPSVKVSPSVQVRAPAKKPGGTSSILIQESSPAEEFFA